MTEFHCTLFNTNDAGASVLARQPVTVTVLPSGGGADVLDGAGVCAAVAMAAPTASIEASADLIPALQQILGWTDRGVRRATAQLRLVRRR